MKFEMKSLEGARVSEKNDMKISVKKNKFMWPSLPPCSEMMFVQVTWIYESLAPEMASHAC